MEDLVTLNTILSVVCTSDITRAEVKSLYYEWLDHHEALEVKWLSVKGRSDRR